MIPHRLNLLSPEKYQNLKQMVSFQFIKNLLEIILFILSVGGIILLGGQWLLQDYFSQIAEQIVSVGNRYATTNQEIKKINQTLTNVEKLQKEYQEQVSVLSDLVNKIPAGVVLNSLNFAENQVTIVGTANLRADLLQLKDQLNTLSDFKPLEIPPEQLIAKEKINFSLTLVRR